ncbi:MAG: hypothetical protein IJV74_02280 [Clostridia bacterium]|nr:hypothetical protein [Clostridia bacterium]
MNNTSVFRYSYSAKQNEEVQAIRNKYLPQPESKLEELKRLDKCVHSAGVVRSLLLGIIGCILFGIGICVNMKVLVSSILTLAFGLAIMLAAYPVYRSCFRKAKKKHEPRILELIAELSHTFNN